MVGSVVLRQTIIFGRHEFNHGFGNIGVAAVDANGNARVFGHFVEEGSEHVRYEVTMIYRPFDVWRPLRLWKETEGKEICRNTRNKSKFK
jgi:hypothetical protein